MSASFTWGWCWIGRAAKVVFMASQSGGMEIEEVAHETPELIYKEYIEPAVGLQPYQARKLAFKLGLKPTQINAGGDVHDGAVQGVRRDGFDADGDQSVHHDEGRQADGAGLQDQLRRQRDVPA